MMQIIRFVKDWTLPIAMVIGVLAYVAVAFTPALDPVSLFFIPVFQTLLPVLLFLVLFVNFCKVDFRKMRPVGWHLWISLVQLFFVLIIVAFILFFKLQAQHLILAEALLTCVIAPCAAASPVVTAKLGGNLENMTSYTLISNLITALFIPVIFPLIDPTSDLTFLEACLLILYRVCLVLLLPMLLAYVVKHYVQRVHRWVLSMKDLSFYLWAFCLGIVTGTTVRNIVHADTTGFFLVLIAVCSLLICFGQFFVGRLVGRHCHSLVECGQALGQKNTSFAIWISCAYLNPLSSVGPGCYILWQNIVNSLELWHHRRLDSLSGCMVQGGETEKN